MNINASIYVAGHQGLVGSAILRTLKEQGYNNIIVKSFEELDLRNQQATHLFFKQERPQYVFLAAARVGGIYANSKYPAQFMYDNLMITSNVIHASYLCGVEKLLFLGSSCIYPRDCVQPITEDALLTGPLEQTNEAYALAKIAGLKLAAAYRKQYGNNFISAMPTNLYGPGDNFDIYQAHVIPAMINKMYQAHVMGHKEVIVWGTGKARREFMYSDDCARALVLLMQQYNEEQWINIGTGTDITIYELAHLIKECIGYSGTIVFNTDFPDGTSVKRLNIEKLQALGFKTRVNLHEGLMKTIAWFTNNVSKAQKRDQKELP